MLDIPHGMLDISQQSPLKYGFSRIKLMLNPTIAISHLHTYNYDDSLVWMLCHTMIKFGQIMEEIIVVIFNFID